MKRRISLALVLILALAGAVTVATPAQAATRDVDCNASTGVERFTLHPGETLTINATNCYSLALQSDYPVGFFAAALTVDFAVFGLTEFPPLGNTGSAGDDPITIWFTAPMELHSSTAQFHSASYPGLSNVDFFIEVVPWPSIPNWVQAVGRQSSTTACPTGWGESWQEWARPVTGGWVCTRSVPMYGN